MNRQLRTAATLLLSLFSVAQLPAQKTEVILTSTLKHQQVGAPIPIQIEVLHSPQSRVLFPDSATGFPGFEVRTLKGLPTRTQGDLSRDYGVYELYTWETTEQQSLQVKCGIITGKDTTWVTSNTVEFTIEPLIRKFTDSLEVRAFVKAWTIKEPFNRRAFFILLALGTLALILLILLLRSPFAKWMRSRRVMREWRTYRKRLDELPGLLDEPASYITALNLVWKNYFDPQGRRALRSLAGPELGPALAAIESLSEEERRKLEHSSYVAELILFANRRSSRPDLESQLRDVSAIMEKELSRRLEAARS